MAVMSFLKNTSIDSKPFNIHIDFQLTISNWCIDNVPKSINTCNSQRVSKGHSLVFQISMNLVLVFLFQKAQKGIVEEIKHDHVKILILKNHKICSMFNTFITNKSQSTLILGYFIINLKTKLIISYEQINTINNCKGGLHIRYNLTTTKRHYRISYMY